MIFHIPSGITMLLALAVFLSIISTLIPPSSDNIPNVTIYLCVTMATSVITVIESIATEYLYKLKTVS